MGINTLMFDVVTSVVPLEDLIREYKGDKIIQCDNGKLSVNSIEYNVTPGKWIAFFSPFTTASTILCPRRHLILYHEQAEDIVVQYIPSIDEKASINRVVDTSIVCGKKKYEIVKDVSFIREDRVILTNILSFTLYCSTAHPMSRMALEALYDLKQRMITSRLWCYFPNSPIGYAHYPDYIKVCIFNVDITTIQHYGMQVLKYNEPKEMGTIALNDDKTLIWRSISEDNTPININPHSKGEEILLLLEEVKFSSITSLESIYYYILNQLEHMIVPDDKMVWLDKDGEVYLITTDKTNYSRLDPHNVYDGLVASF